MSADNYIFLDQKTKEVYHCTASCVCSHKRHCLKCQKGSLIKQCKTLEEAVLTADKADTYDIEYGISFSLWCK